MDNKYSLTFPQKNIWLVEKFFGKSAINTIVGIFNVNKDFSKDICEKAINKMVELNDSLRLQMEEVEDNVYQKVLPYEYFDVDFYDLTNKSDVERKDLEEKLTVLPFDIIRSKLYYFAIVKLTENKRIYICKIASFSV